MCCAPAPRRCKERVTAPTPNFAPNAVTSRREIVHNDDESDSVAPFVVYALEIARSVSLDASNACSVHESRERRRATG